MFTSTTPLISTTTSPIPMSLYLCSFPGAVIRPITLFDQCPFDDYAMCVPVQTNSCTQLSINYFAFYALTTVHFDVTQQKPLYSVGIFSDVSCGKSLLGANIGVYNLSVSQCAPIGFSGDNLQNQVNFHIFFPINIFVKTSTHRAPLDSMNRVLLASTAIIVVRLSLA